MENLSARLQARYLRDKILKGYRTDSTFYALVTTLTDAEILESHADFVAAQTEHVEHVAMLKLYETRQTKADPRLNRLYASAQRAAQ